MHRWFSWNKYKYIDKLKIYERGWKKIEISARFFIRIEEKWNKRRKGDKRRGLLNC